MDKFLINIIACPICTGRLVHSKKKSELICQKDRVAFPIRKNILVLMEEKSRKVI
ncbi:Trm112 family protein [Candidatus Riesia pediculicola]|uniref:Trm112 family protein n=1 Tax=Candidatus Riesia pediculicola TaxID=401619 RepID=UPI0009E5D1A7|nr:Trm112 family protein [Candidatus Riesia pediculicola]